MDKDIKEKWVKALRSGEYKQGTGTFLDDKNRYCCLGVLCAITNAQPVPFSSTGWMHLNKYLDYCDEQAPLYRMNDDGASFAEIADYIEEHL